MSLYVCNLLYKISFPLRCGFKGQNNIDKLKRYKEMKISTAGYCTVRSFIDQIRSNSLKSSFVIFILIFLSKQNFDLQNSFNYRKEISQISILQSCRRLDRPHFFVVFTKIDCIASKIWPTRAN